MAKNSKAEDIWRTPRMHAWTHKPFGIIGEVIDIEKIRKRYDAYFNN
jgi:hypothetical protein